MNISSTVKKCISDWQMFPEVSLGFSYILLWVGISIRMYCWEAVIGGGVSFLFLALLEHTGKPRSLLITDTPQGILQMLKLREWEDLEQDSEQP